MFSNWNGWIKYVLITLVIGVRSIAKQNTNIVMEIKNVLTSPGPTFVKDATQTVVLLETTALHLSSEINKFTKENISNKKFSLIKKIIRRRRPFQSKRGEHKTNTITEVTTINSDNVTLDMTLVNSDLQVINIPTVHDVSTDSITARRPLKKYVKVKIARKKFHTTNPVKPGSSHGERLSNIMQTRMPDSYESDYEGYARITYGPNSTFVYKNHTYFYKDLEDLKANNTFDYDYEAPTPCPHDNETHLNADRLHCSSFMFRAPKEDYMKRQKTIDFVKFIDNNCGNYTNMSWTHYERTSAVASLNNTLNVLHAYFDVEYFANKLAHLPEEYQKLEYVNEQCSNYLFMVNMIYNEFKSYIHHCVEHNESSKITTSDIVTKIYYFWCPDDGRKFLDFYYHDGVDCYESLRPQFEKCTPLFFDKEFDIMDPLSILTVTPFLKYEYTADECQRYDEMASCLVRAAEQCNDTEHAWTMQDLMANHIRQYLTCDKPFAVIQPRRHGQMTLVSIATTAKSWIIFSISIVILATLV